MRLARRLRLACIAAIALAASCTRPSPQGSAGDARAAPDHSAGGAGQTPELADPPEAQRARQRLIDAVEASGEPWSGSGRWDPRVLAAMRAVPRHLFVPNAPLARAYADEPQPIGQGQTISQPKVVATMTQALSLRGSEKVLEIGTGSGYQAAILARLSSRVYTIEIVEELGTAARARLRELGYRNIEVRIGDGYKGWPEQAPFDRIVVTAAPPTIPQPLVDQLAEGGILVAPVGEQGTWQELLRYTKAGGRLTEEKLGSVKFVPMVPGKP